MNQVGLKGETISPKKEVLLREIQKEKRSVSKLEKIIIQQQEVINRLQCSSNSAASSVVNNTKSPALRHMLQMKQNNNHSKPQGNRYSMDQKIFALSLAKHGNFGYKHLRSSVGSLPSKRTLNRLLEKVPIAPGTNDHVTKAIRRKNLKPEDKNVLFVLDETKLKKRLMFTPGSASVTGFATDGSGNRTSDIAGSVLVGMITGINFSFAQPICYYFSKAGFNSKDLKKIIVQTIRDIVDAGLHVVGVVTDQGKANKSAIDALRNETKGGREGVFFKILGYDQEIFILCDIAHLIKTTRNCFMGDWGGWLRSQTEEKNKWMYDGNVIELVTILHASHIEYKVIRMYAP
ncbi:uncharacterized protein LOC124293007 [Neodiprion lecontei]|uniref:Uncharacterized protein LOC124293007 n=1 Tax=Neodiprion lecontei TaxID=441921 RepID=A0ABM3FIL9_NEOLC|nr:uncharacterized protein LOC124293007 [Neodiprion lecontei]